MATNFRKCFANLSTSSSGMISNYLPEFSAYPTVSTMSSTCFSKKTVSKIRKDFLGIEAPPTGNIGSLLGKFAEHSRQRWIGHHFAEPEIALSLVATTEFFVCVQNMFHNISLGCFALSIKIGNLTSMIAEELFNCPKIRQKMFYKIREIINLIPNNIFSKNRSLSRFLNFSYLFVNFLAFSSKLTDSGIGV